MSDRELVMEIVRRLNKECDRCSESKDPTMQMLAPGMMAAALFVAKHFEAFSGRGSPMTAPRMTRADALAEARKRWGEKGEVNIFTEDASLVPEGEEAIQQFEVGVLIVVWDDDDEPLSRHEEPAVKGSGDSWEAAFADADRRAE